MLIRLIINIVEIIIIVCIMEEFLTIQDEEFIYKRFKNIN